MNFLKKIRVNTESLRERCRIKTKERIRKNNRNKSSRDGYNGERQTIKERVRGVEKSQTGYNRLQSSNNNNYNINEEEEV